MVSFSTKGGWFVPGLVVAHMVMPMVRDGEMLFRFDYDGDASAWQSVTDRVMGGVSVGQSEMTADGTLRFFGKVSLENNGGFASIRSLPKERDLSGYDGILMRIRGDGHRYALNVRTGHEVMAGAYRHKFDTAPGDWQQVFLPFTRFQLTSFGQVVSGAPPLNTNKIRSVGFLISDEQAGPFELQVDWIMAVATP